MSNLFGFNNRPVTGPLDCRPARRDELHRGLRIVLGTNGHNASDAELLDFLRTAVQRRIDTTALWIAEQSGKIAWAILPIVSPGHTMLLLCPGGTGRPPAAAPPLIAAVCEHYRSRGIHLAQALLDPSSVALAGTLDQLGFERMAELLYMQRPTRGDDARDRLITSVKTHPYRTGIDHLFRETILATYRQSLDCPALNGMRSIDDIMAGHQAAGEFDPQLWTLLVLDNQPVGVTLLSRQRPADTLELVYLGLTPSVRGKGLGDIAMHHLLGQAAASGMSRLSLAVDAHNTPAIRLYTRHGFAPMGSKHAFLRDLRHARQPV